MSRRSPRVMYTSMTKSVDITPLIRLMIPCGNSVRRKRTTTTRSMRVVRFVFRSRDDVSSLAALAQRNFRRRCSAAFIVRTSRRLSMVSPTQGTSLTRSAWIQKLRFLTRTSCSVSSLNSTIQMSGAEESLACGWWVCGGSSKQCLPWTLIVTKLGMQTIRVMRLTRKTASLDRRRLHQMEPCRG